MRLTRSLTIPTLALALLAGGGTAAAVTNSAHSAAPVTVCEDGPVCALPDIPANDTKRATAWDAWDNQGGWTMLRVDPSREVRVDVTGYSPSPVPGELSLRGADGLWYVFDAR